MYLNTRQGFMTVGVIAVVVLIVVIIVWLAR